MSEMQRERKDVCTERLCSSRHYARGWCRRHWNKKRRDGVFVVDPNWRRAPKARRAYRGSGVSITSNGYRRIRLGPNKWVLEHRLRMEQELGRSLYSDENVHHLDGDRLNNCSENLELWVTGQPSGQRVSDAVAWAKEILRRYP